MISNILYQFFIFQDSEPLDSFYYTNWEDTIYDQFDDYGERLPVEGTTTAEDGSAKEKGTGTTKPVQGKDTNI